MWWPAHPNHQWPELFPSSLYHFCTLCDFLRTRSHLPKISKMVLNGVLKPFGVESILKLFWENQNGLGQKFAKVCHYGLVFPTKTWYFEWKSHFLRLKSQKWFLNGVLKPFCVESILEILWENQNDLGQKFVKVAIMDLYFLLKLDFLSENLIFSA